MYLCKTQFVQLSCSCPHNMRCHSTGWSFRSVFSSSWRQSSIVHWTVRLLATWLRIYAVCLTCRPDDVWDRHSLTSSISASRSHSSRIRFLRFLKIKKRDVLRFLKCPVKKRRKHCPSFHFLHFKIANEHFHCKTVTHMSCYTYNIILKLFIFG